MKFTHKTTNKEISVNSVRTVIRDGETVLIDLSGKYDLSEYNEVKGKTEYASIAIPRAVNDRKL